MKRLMVVACLLGLSGSVIAQQGVKQTAPSGVTVTRESGGSIQTPLGYGIVLAKGSSLTREFIAIHDNALPVELVGTPGVTTVFKSGRGSGSYEYSANFSIQANDTLSAIEVRFLIFDIWGNHVKTLSASEIVDIKPGVKSDFNGAWNLFSENDAERHYASIAYVARVRTQAGKVIDANPAAVIDEAKKFAKKFSADDLDPKPDRK